MTNALSTSSLGYLIADLSRLYGRVFDRRTAHTGVTRVQWRALKAIAIEQGRTQASLAEALDLEPIAVGRVLDRLQKAGFIERRPDPNDRRCWRLYLGQRSASVSAEVEQIAEAMRAESLHGVSAEDLATTQRVLGQIRQTLTTLDRASRD